MSICDTVWASGLRRTKVPHGYYDLRWCKLWLQIFICIQPAESSLYKTTRRVWRQAADGSVMASQQVRLLLRGGYWKGIRREYGLMSIRSTHLAELKRPGNSPKLGKKLSGNWSPPRLRPELRRGACPWSRGRWFFQWYPEQVVDSRVVFTAALTVWPLLNTKSHIYGQSRLVCTSCWRIELSHWSF